MNELQLLHVLLHLTLEFRRVIELIDYMYSHGLEDRDHVAISVQMRLIFVPSYDLIQHLSDQLIGELHQLEVFDQVLLLLSADYLLGNVNNIIRHPRLGALIEHGWRVLAQSIIQSDH